MNTNLIHNVLNISMIVIAGATAGLTAAGCVTLDTGTLDCTNVEYINPSLAAGIVAGLGFVKMAINVVRDGFKGLTKNQPPVQ